MGKVTNKVIITELKKLKKKYNIERMLLFGSRARGDELITSDVDVIAISKQFLNTPFKKRPNKLLDAWKLPIDLELLCYSPEEIERKKKEIGIISAALKYAKAI